MLKIILSQEEKHGEQQEKKKCMPIESSSPCLKAAGSSSRWCPQFLRILSVQIYVSQTACHRHGLDTCRRRKEQTMKGLSLQEAKYRILITLGSYELLQCMSKKPKLTYHLYNQKWGNWRGYPRRIARINHTRPEDMEPHKRRLNLFIATATENIMDTWRDI